MDWKHLKSMSSIQKERQQKKLYRSFVILSLIFPDGTVIWRKSAIETYIATIKHIGYERVAALNINHGGFNAVSRTKRPTEPGRIWQQESDGWFITRILAIGRR